MSALTWILDALFQPRETERVLRTIDSDTLAPHLSPTTIALTNIPAVALLPYRNELIQAAIIEAKFHDNAYAQKLLGSLLAEYLLEFSSEEAALGGALILVPVPLSSKRQKDRGYNQVQKICANAVARLGKSFSIDTNSLRRIRDTSAQTTLTRNARLTNMHDAFSAIHDLDTSATYILIDDVVTTGATLEAAIDALQNAGARHTLPVALAH